MRAAQFIKTELAEGSLNEFAPGGNSASSYYAVTENFINEFTQQKQEELQDLIDAGWTKQDLAQAGTLQGQAADIAHFEQVRDGFLKGLKSGFDAYLQGDTQLKDQLGAYWIDNDLPLNQDWESIYGEPWGDDGLDEGVAEGSNDTIYPNAEVIKLRNGRPIGEIYQDENGWGFFHYRMDSGNDFIDSREDAIEGLRDLHQETGRSRRDTMEQGVAEGNYDRDDYYNARQGREYGKDLTATGYGGDGSKTRRDDIFKGQSKRLPADPFARTSGAVPKTGTGRIHSNALPGEMDEGLGSKLAGLGLAGAMALGSAGAQARVSGDQDPNINRFTGKPVATQQSTDVAPATASASQSFSKEYLQRAADPNRTGRYMISVEKAQELLSNMKEGTDNEKIGGRYDADDFDDMVSRLKKLAGAGPMKTVYDPDRRVYRNMPTAQQPKKAPQ